MKIVKRIGVFETNSSSSHSFVIVDANKSEKLTEYTFELVSPLAKTVWLLGLIDNALREDANLEPEIRQEQIEYATKCISENLFDIPEGVTVEEYIESEVDWWVNGDKRQILAFKEAVIQQFCKLENMDEKSAEMEFIKEASRVLVLEKLAIDEKNIKEHIARIKDYDLEMQNCCKKYGDTMQAFREYLAIQYQNNVYKFKNFQCDFYFENGCLNYCDCKFENFYNIINSFEPFRNNMPWPEFAKWFLSPACKVYGIENYCGCMFLNSRSQF